MLFRSVEGSASHGHRSETGDAVHPDGTARVHPRWSARYGGKCGFGWPRGDCPDERVLSQMVLWLQQQYGLDSLGAGLVFIGAVVPTFFVRRPSLAKHCSLIRFYIKGVSSRWNGLLLSLRHTSEHLLIRAGRLRTAGAPNGSQWQACCFPSRRIRS